MYYPYYYLSILSFSLLGGGGGNSVSNAFVFPSSTTTRKLEATTISGAQDKIVSQVESAINSGADGRAFTINYVAKSGFQGASMALRIPGVDIDQHCLIDTGSSSIAFCNSSIAAGVQDSKTNFVQYGLYGGIYQCFFANESTGDTADYSNATCDVLPDWNSITNQSSCYGFSEYFYGSVYNGHVTVYESGNEEPVYTMQDVSYAIMEGQQNMTCENIGFSGIFGVAFSGNTDSTYELPGNASASDLVSPTCTDSPEGSLAVPNRSFVEELNSTQLPSPLQETLQLSGSYQETFGIYFNYDAAMHADTINTPDLGIFYAGDLATENEHFNGGVPQIAASLNNPTTWAREYFWSVILQNITIGNSTATYPDGFCGSEGDAQVNCFADSGTPQIVLPLPQEYCNGTIVIPENEALYINLQGFGLDNPAAVTLKLPVPFLIDQINEGWAQCSGSQGNLILGFPIFSYYYLVYDMANGAVTFVDLPRMAASLPTASTTTRWP